MIDVLKKMILVAEETLISMASMVVGTVIMAVILGIVVGFMYALGKGLVLNKRRQVIMSAIGIVLYMVMMAGIAYWENPVPIWMCLDCRDKTWIDGGLAVVFFVLLEIIVLIFSSKYNPELDKGLLGSLRRNKIVVSAIIIILLVLFYVVGGRALLMAQGMPR